MLRCSMVARLVLAAGGAAAVVPQSQAQLCTGSGASLVLHTTALDGTTIGASETGAARVRRFLVSYEVSGPLATGLAGCNLLLTLSPSGGTVNAPGSVWIRSAPTGFGADRGIFPPFGPSSNGGESAFCYPVFGTPPCSQSMYTVPWTLNRFLPSGNLYIFQIQAGDAASGTYSVTIGYLPVGSSGGVEQLFSYYDSGCACNQGSCASPNCTGATVTVHIAPAGGGCTQLCRADFDCTGALAVADIFAFLNGWFAGIAAADFDGVDGLQVQDVFAFLNAWFTGC